MSHERGKNAWEPSPSPPPRSRLLYPHTHTICGPTPRILPSYQQPVHIPPIGEEPLPPHHSKKITNITPTTRIYSTHTVEGNPCDQARPSLTDTHPHASNEGLHGGVPRPILHTVIRPQQVLQHAGDLLSNPSHGGDRTTTTPSTPRDELKAKLVWTPAIPGFVTGCRDYVKTGGD
jgi:hypothetical protein